MNGLLRIRLIVFLLLALGLCQGCSESDSAAQSDRGHYDSSGPHYNDDHYYGDAGNDDYYYGDAGNDDYYYGDAGTGSGESNGSNLNPTQSWQRSSENTSFASVTVGGGETLELERIRITAQLEGLRARTIVDHIYYNPHDSTLEGTFRYSLPPQASVSYYAMFVGTDQDSVPWFFGDGEELVALDPLEVALEPPGKLVHKIEESVWGELREARVVERTRGLQVYEEITNRRIDPALVEEVGPNTFEARVFPIPARGYNRVIIAYEQTLPRIGGRLEYVFHNPEGEIESHEFTMIVNSPDVLEVDYLGDATEPPALPHESIVAFHLVSEGASPTGSFAYQLTMDRADDQIDALSGTDPVLEESFFVARLHPAIGALPEVLGGADQAVFLLDTSRSAHPQNFGINVLLMEAILVASPELERFNLITFDAGARWWSQGWLSNTEEVREMLLDALDGVLLEGATDFGRTLSTLADPPMEVQPGSALDVFLLSDGVVTWGERDLERMLAAHATQTPFQERVFAYRTGLGAENDSLYQRLTHNGAIFNCLSPDDVPAAANAHRNLGMQLASVRVVGVGETPALVSDLLVVGRQAMLYPGGNLRLAGRLLQPGEAVVELEGTLNEEPLSLEIPVWLYPSGELAARARAEIAVAQLVGTRDHGLESLALALSQHYGIASRLGSFLVLETDEEYTLYELEREELELGELELDEAIVMALENLAEPLSTLDKLIAWFSLYPEVSNLLEVEGGLLIDDLAELSGQAGLELPQARLAIPLVFRSQVPAAYASFVPRDVWELQPFIDEAQRRFELGQRGAAVRALSSVVEAHPSSAEFARLVGYRMFAQGLPEEAAHLFFNVLERRPFEPQSYRDLGTAVWSSNPALAALMFEAVLAGSWDPRFGLLTTVVREEYALLYRDLLSRDPQGQLTQYVGQRQQELGLTTPEGDLRVTMTWNTNYTDIDLWVTDPAEEKCYYANRRTRSGAELLDDITQGYGPERFIAREAIPGSYLVEVHYYGNNGNQLIAETTVTVTIMTRMGTPDESVERHLVTLRQPGDAAQVARIAF